MILKSIGTTFLLLAAYSLYLHNSVADKKIEGQHQWQDNTIKAQDYLYANEVPDNIIIGSSLSCRIESELLPENFYNLSLGGQSVFDGLEILTHQQIFPKRVFVEMNMVKRAGDPSFGKSLFNPILFFLRKEVVPMREKDQPAVYALHSSITFLGEKIYDPFTRRLVNPMLNKLNFSKKEDNNASVATDNFYDDLIKKQKTEFDMPFNEVAINDRFKELKAKIALLKKQGTEIVFFEMPLHPELENTIQMKEIRKLFLQNFPADSFVYLDKPVYADYTTTDGLHLGGDNAKKFTHFFIDDVTAKVSK
ncbi:hypothetical protein LK994_12565 [Ferruginibacter lapsinanis]|uniref:hypothetical protein n=1 Tax=Ferruginibacter lapsinanis TaxID=563172 RepID=UPI001E5D1757|nr:hypothetical protein [Ferruginibacter lapsinanis]UEG49466.1 hypothetical protein LK994_12565 [Ferruginibacter lapsinanis]